MKRGRPRKLNLLKASLGPISPKADANGKYPCPECGELMETPQGRGAHRRAKHGYVSPREDANTRRNRKAREKELQRLGEAAQAGQAQAEAAPSRAYVTRFHSCPYCTGDLVFLEKVVQMRERRGGTDAT